MKPLAAKYIDVIQLLANLPSKLRAKHIMELSPCHIKTISEVFKNFLKNRLTQDKKVIRKVHKYKTEIYQVALKSTPIYKKKNILLSKKGGFILGALLPLAATLISSLFK